MALLTDGTAAVRKLRFTYELTENDVARATGASLSTVRRWNAATNGQRRGGRATNYDDKIDDLVTIVDILAEEYPPEIVVAWLRGRCRELDYERPVDVLGAEDADAFARVRGAAHAAILGDPS